MDLSTIRFTIKVEAMEFSSGDAPSFYEKVRYLSLSALTMIICSRKHLIRCLLRARKPQSRKRNSAEKSRLFQLPRFSQD